MILEKNQFDTKVWPKDISYIDSDYFLWGYSINHYRDGELIDEGYYLKGINVRKNKLPYKNFYYL